MLIQDFVRRAILGRYKNSPWGHVQFPRHVPKVRTVSPALLDPGKVGGSPGYDNLKRHRERKKKIGWPIGAHHVVQLEKHFLKVLGDGLDIRLILSQSDVYINAYKNNLSGVGMRLRIGAEAFLRLWEHVQAESQGSCEICKKRVSLKGLKSLSS